IVRPSTVFSLKEWPYTYFVFDVGPPFSRRPSFAASEGLQDRADDRPREFGGHPFEAVGVLLEERRGIGSRAACRRLIFLPEHHARVLPQHLVLAHVTELDPRGHRDRVA